MDTARRRLLAALPLAMALPFVSRAAKPPKSWATPDWQVLRLLDGKVILVDFWSSKCQPCRYSFPWMNQLHERHADFGLVIIGVNRDEDRAQADAFLKRFPAQFQIEYDPDGKLARQFDVHMLPTSFLIDRKGQIRERFELFRASERAEREKWIKFLLDEPAWDAPPKKSTKPR
jgi:thiol-disulfide isomerase/thioredoxin